MKEKLAESIDILLQWVESGKGFISEQAPFIIQEIVLKRRLHGAGFIVLGVALLFIAYLCYKYEDEPRLGQGFSLIGGLVVTIMGSFTIAYTFMCPRLVVLDFLKGMM